MWFLNTIEKGQEGHKALGNKFYRFLASITIDRDKYLLNRNGPDCTLNWSKIQYKKVTQAVMKL